MSKWARVPGLLSQKPGWDSLGLKPLPCPCFRTTQIRESWSENKVNSREGNPEASLKLESWIQLFLKLVSFQLCSPNNLSSRNSKTNERPLPPVPDPFP